MIHRSFTFAIKKAHLTCVGDGSIATDASQMSRYLRPRTVACAPRRPSIPFDLLTVNRARSVFTQLSATVAWQLSQLFFPRTVNSCVYAVFVCVCLAVCSSISLCRFAVQFSVTRWYVRVRYKIVLISNRLHKLYCWVIFFSDLLTRFYRLFRTSMNKSLISTI